MSDARCGYLGSSRSARAYPRGIECDDAQTTARMETNGMLVVEMPITRRLGESTPR